MTKRLSPTCSPCRGPRPRRQQPPTTRRAHHERVTCLSACRISSRTIAFCLALANGRVGAAFAKSFARLCGLAVGLPGSPLTGSPLVGSPLAGSPLDTPLATPLATPFAIAGSPWIGPSAAAAAAAASRCFLRAFLAPPERFFPCDYETGARETSDQARRRAARGVRRRPRNAAAPGGAAAAAEKHQVTVPWPCWSSARPSATSRCWLFVVWIDGSRGYARSGVRLKWGTRLFPISVTPIPVIIHTIRLEQRCRNVIFLVVYHLLNGQQSNAGQGRTNRINSWRLLGRPCFSSQIKDSSGGSGRSG
jgi:hypothetical protein